jgi:hypothetical protein
VIAAPPVRGFRSRFERLRGVSIYVVAAVGGALLTGLVFYLAGRVLSHRPMQLIALVALVATMSVTGLFHLPESRWRVPRSWGRFGHTMFAALFGVVLGLGVLTAVSSAGYYVLLAWAVLVPSWSYVWPTFVAFGVGRAIPLVLIAVLSGGQEGRLPSVLQQMRARAQALVYVEAALLVAVAVLFSNGSMAI